MGRFCLHSALFGARFASCFRYLLLWHKRFAFSAMMDLRYKINKSQLNTFFLRSCYVFIIIFYSCSFMLVVSGEETLRQKSWYEKWGDWKV